MDELLMHGASIQKAFILAIAGLLAITFLGALIWFAHGRSERAESESGHLSAGRRPSYGSGAMPFIERPAVEGLATRSPETLAELVRRDPAVGSHVALMNRLEKRFRAADRRLALLPLHRSHLDREVAKLRQKYREDISDASFECNGPQCRLEVTLRHGRRLRAMVNEAHWLGDHTGGTCLYDAVSEPGPPAMSKPQKLWAYYVCSEKSEPAPGAPATQTPSRAE